MNNDLISRSALIAVIKTNSPTFYDGQDIANWQAKCINEAPAVDAEPVRHGHWDDSFDGITPYCSVCGMSHNCINRTPDYCPHCGARMNGGNDDGHRHDHQ